MTSPCRFGMINHSCGGTSRRHGPSAWGHTTARPAFQGFWHHYSAGQDDSGVFMCLLMHVFFLLCVCFCVWLYIMHRRMCWMNQIFLCSTLLLYVSNFDFWYMVFLLLMYFSLFARTIDVFFILITAKCPAVAVTWWVNVNVLRVLDLCISLPAPGKGLVTTLKSQSEQQRYGLSWGWVEVFWGLVSFWNLKHLSKKSKKCRSGTDVTEALKPRESKA